MCCHDATDVFQSSANLAKERTHVFVEVRPSLSSKIVDPAQILVIKKPRSFVNEKITHAIEGAGVLT